MRSVPDYFGCLVFNDKVMKAKLPTEVYESLKKTREEGEVPLSIWKLNLTLARQNISL